MWMIEAQTSGIGVHNEDGKSAAIRDVKWVIEDPRMLFDELKGKPLKGLFLIIICYLIVWLCNLQSAYCERSNNKLTLSLEQIHANSYPAEI